MTLLLIVLVATAAMAGLSAFVSVVHYPLFALVGEPGWVAYHAAHSRRTTWVVVAPMVVELAGSALLVAHRPAGVGVVGALIGLALAAAAWTVTFACSVPDHGRLAGGYDRRVGLRLERFHHLRTLLWGAHVVLLCTLVAAAA
jgi:hypothetical protein